MKVCILSNSHGASLKSGLDQSRDALHGVDFTLFAIPNKGFSKLTLNRETKSLETDVTRLKDLIKMTSGGYESVPLSEFDVIWIYGQFFTVPRLDRRMSSAVKNAAIDAIMSGSLAHKLARRIRTVVDTPILISPEPLRSDAGNLTCSKYDMPLEPMAYGEIASLIAKRKKPKNISYLWQPSETIHETLATKPQFSVGSEKMSILRSGSHSKSDTRHMNGDFGAIVLSDMSKHLSETNVKPM